MAAVYEYRSRLVTVTGDHRSADDPINEIAQDGWRVISCSTFGDDVVFVLFERVASPDGVRGR